MLSEEKWSWSHSSSIGDGWRRWLLHRLGCITTRSKAKSTISTSKRFVLIIQITSSDIDFWRGDAIYHRFMFCLMLGRNLQICFMNEAASDSESSDSETCPKLSKGVSRKKNVQRPSSLMNHRNACLNNNPYSSRPLSIAKSVMDPVERGNFNRFRVKLCNQ